MCLDLVCLEVMLQVYAVSLWGPASACALAIWPTLSTGNGELGLREPKRIMATKC